MASGDFEQKIEEIAEALLLADTADSVQLDRIADDLVRLADAAQDSALAEVRTSASSAAEILHSVAAGEAQKPSAALDVVVRTVTALQSIICENQSSRTAALPEELRDAGRTDTAAEDEQAVARDAEAAPSSEERPEDSQAASPAPDIDLDLLQAFIVEANEHLDAVEGHLLTLETSPDDEDAVHAVFRAFHTIKGAAAFMNLDEIRTLSHALEDLLTRLRSKELIIDDQVIDVTLSATDHLKQLVGALRESFDTHRLPPPSGQLPGYLDVIEILVKGETIAPSARVKPAEQVAAKSTGEGRGTRTRLGETIRVDAERLDRVLDAIGELVIVESMVTQSDELRRAASPEVDRRLTQLDKITRDLHEMSTSLRMVPIRPVFLKMARMARDAAKQMGKPIDFVTSGENTELDKAVVDQLSDPLAHLIRNAVGHGIEASPEVRRRKGKPEAGVIQLRAFHRGGNIYVEIEDDGHGLDREKIIARSKERGLITDDTGMPDHEVFDLIFLPGFSTAEEVTMISGRGVGMDVVRSTVENLRGTIAVSSSKGKGTTITLGLPLTLAIIDGMIVKVGDERYIIPKLSIVRCIRPRDQEIRTVTGKGEMLVTADDSPIPLFRLANLFGISTGVEDPTKALIVIIEDGVRETALLVDALIGQQQIVIKSIGDQLGALRGLSGGGIMSDGTVGLVIDASGLVKLAHSGTAYAPQPHAREAVLDAVRELEKSEQEENV